MNPTLDQIRRLVFDVPRRAKLAYCLLRDERVPAAPKTALLASLGIIVSPLDFPAWVPVLGELDMLALGVLAVEVFVRACPELVVKEHEAAIKQKQSLFDQDFGAAVAVAREGANRAYSRLRARAARRRGLEVV
ncbi:MAG TPA: hypothetical protein VK131_10620 [Candidatus Acidoferrales bacterium]|nr:hypothetical protein [Candidatus Acidoferrales bacterium]